MPGCTLLRIGPSPLTGTSQSWVPAAGCVITSTWSSSYQVRADGAGRPGASCTMWLMKKTPAPPRVIAPSITCAAVPLPVIMAIRTPSRATLSPVTGPVPGGRLTSTGGLLADAGITQTPGEPLTRPATQRSPELSQLGVEKSFPVSLLRRPASVADACGLAA